MICPICSGVTRRLFTRHGHWILGCEGCGHHCAEVAASEGHVARVYGDSYFEGGGDGYPDYLCEGDLLRARGQWYARLLRRYTIPGAVLDVGAAAGFVLQGFLDSGWRGRGIEPNPRMAHYARACLRLGVDVGTLEGLQRNERYDLVSMIQVVSHFYDLRKALQKAARVTRPAGFWLIETWDRESWTARAFGRYWHEYSPPSVLHWFSPEGLRRLAEQFGLREVARGRPPKWIGGAHAKALLRHKLKGSRLERLTGGLLRVVPDRLAIPYLGDDLFWALFQATGACGAQHGGHSG